MRFGWTPVLLALLYGLIYFSDHTVLSDKSVRLGIRCTDGHYTVSINGRTHESETGANPAGGKIGFYVWHRGEASARPPLFRNLEVQPLDDSGEPLHLSLTELRQMTRFRQPSCSSQSGLVSRDARWKIREGAGLEAESAAPGAALIVLEGFEADNFTMSAEILHPVDAGFYFHADDQGHGEILTVRPTYNDALLFAVSNCIANPIDHLFEYQPLQAGTELLRLTVLICRIIFWAGALWMAALLLEVPFKNRIPSFPQPLPARPVSRARPAVLVFACAFLAFAFVAAQGFHKIPHITDEAAYLFQAKIFAAGKLWAPPPSVPGFFDHYHLMVEGTRWYSKYPPFFSLVLSAGVKAGMPWLVNPLLGALLTVTVYLIAKRLFSLRIALIASALFILSPFHLFMSATMMAHTLTALCLWQMIHHSLAGMESGQALRFAAAGAFWSAAFATRPFTATAILLPLGIAAAICRRNFSARATAGKAVSSALAGAYPILILFACWSVLYSSENGQPMIPYISYHTSDTLGFGAAKGADWLMTWGSWGHTPTKALRSISVFLDNTMQHLHGWPFHLSLVFVPLAFLNRTYDRRPMVFFLGIYLSLVAGHALYWATEHLGYGARYWYAGMPGLTLLSAIGLDALIGPAQTADPGTRRRGPALFPVMVASIFILWNLTIYLPPKFIEAHTYGGISTRLGDEVASRGLTRALIFVKTENTLYNDGFHLNDPFLREGPYFVNDLGPRNHELMSAFPGYRAFRWDKNILTPFPDAGDQSF